MAGRKFTVFSLFYFVFEGTIFMYKSPGAYILRGHLTGGRGLRYGFEGLTFGRAYIWRGLYMEALIFGILRYPFHISSSELCGPCNC